MVNVDRDSVSAVVVAGGLSRRMGQDKRRLRLWGPSRPTLLAHTVQLVASLCADVIVVLNDPEDWRDLPARLVPDVYPDGGALGGIYTGLAAAAHNYALVVASDMPFLHPALLSAMLSRPRNYAILAPRSLQTGATRNQFDVEPLHAIYSKACLSPMRTMLDSGQRTIAALFALVSVVYVEPDEIRRYDPTGRAFLNLNTPAQITEAQQWLGATSQSEDRYA